MKKRTISRKKKRPAKKGVRKSTRKAAYNFSVTAAQRKRLNNCLLSLQRNLEKAVDSYKTVMNALIKI